MCVPQAKYAIAWGTFDMVLAHLTCFAQPHEADTSTAVHVPKDHAPTPLGLGSGAGGGDPAIMAIILIMAINGKFIAMKIIERWPRMVGKE